MDDLPHDTPDARRQLEVCCIRVNSQELAPKLSFYALLPCLLIGYIPVSMVILVDLDCQLLAWYIQVDAVIGIALGSSRGITICVSISWIKPTISISFLRYRGSSLMPSCLTSSEACGFWLRTTRRLTPDSLMYIVLAIPSARTLEHTSHNCLLSSSSTWTLIASLWSGVSENYSHVVALKPRSTVEANLMNFVAGVWEGESLCHNCVYIYICSIPLHRFWSRTFKGSDSLLPIKQCAITPTTKRHHSVKLMPNGAIYPVRCQIVFAPLVDQCISTVITGLPQATHQPRNCDVAVLLHPSFGFLDLLLVPVHLLCEVLQ